MGTEITGTVYIGMAMPVDSSEPRYCTRIGETKKGAKQAVLETVSHQNGGPLFQPKRWVDWDDNHVEKNGWSFLVKEKNLYQ